MFGEVCINCGRLNWRRLLSYAVPIRCSKCGRLLHVYRW